MNNKLTRESLKEYKKEIKKKLKKLEEENVIIIVGTGTCGLAAGADKVFKVFEDEIKRRGMQNIILKQTGCMGLCFSEPNVEVRMKNMPTVVYGRVTEKVAKRILEDHILHHTLVDNRVYEKPALDIVQAKEEA